ncbi:putative disease resistance protein RGA1 [Zea mays]|uniref:Putative disease resistance protein RGA1 n=1 Tax=Zea mays TaxID=4577 RepID=A0A3L6F9A9_MAIZE|nr:putative disease resistance protein RGA1 [Zea mays]
MSGVEAAAISAVASGILKIVGNKLAPLAIRKYSSIVGVEKDLQKLQVLVEDINSWLESAGYQAFGDDASLSWFKQLKDVAYAVDDVVDEYQLKAERNDASGDGGFVSRYMRRKPESVIFQCKAAKKIKAIKKRFAAIVKQRADINIIATSLTGSGHSISHMKKTAVGLPSVPTMDATLILGREMEKHQLISKLTETNDQQKTMIVSIVGLGGSGKTTLAKLVFNDGNTIAKHFKVRLWVHVSQEFGFESIVGKLFEAIAHGKSESHNLQHMVRRISDELTEKVFLLVLDDVWTKDRMELEQFMVLVRSGASGSRILLTTRNSDVAEAVESSYLINLPLLSLADSWQLFIQSFGTTVEGFDREFLDVGNAIVNKCGGVPLAIKVIAGVLRDKKRIQEWQAIRDSNLFDAEGKERRVSACLRLSYLNLPSHLKQCFTICSLFPKGHKIDKERLIDQWIAHDMFASTDAVDYLEYTGYECFSSLVQMSFLQDVEENYYGRVTCKMHDLVHDLAHSILKDEISLVVPKEGTSLTESYRYFSLTKQSRIVPSKRSFGKARAIYVSNSDDTIFGSTMQNARHLRSITMESMFVATIPNAIFQAKHLKYLEISRLRCEALPEAISNFWTLQALHLASSDLLDLPESFGKLTRLRTLNLSKSEKFKRLPDSIGDCQMMSTIDLCHCNSLTLLPDTIGRIERLRVLRLSYTKIERLPSNIITLRNLECLDLCTCQDLVELPEGIGNLDRLQVLNLKGCKSLGGMPVGVGRLSRLQKLGLFVVGDSEKFAGISELANVPRISEELSIRGIPHGMDPEDAQMACLQQKTSLQSLDLEWMAHKACEVDLEWMAHEAGEANMDLERMAHDAGEVDLDLERNQRMTLEAGEVDLDSEWMPLEAGEVDTELEQAVLDGLEPPSQIKELKINGYSGSQHACWMQNQVSGRRGPQELVHFPFLRVVKLSDFPNLKHLDGLVELPCLEDLELRAMPCLESMSGGPFPSLSRLELDTLPSLGEVWLVAETTILPSGEGAGHNVHGTGTPGSGRQVRVGGRLSCLFIQDCPRLRLRPHMPSSLESLHLSESSEQLLQLPADQCLGSSSSYSNFSHLKKLGLWGMTGLGSGRRWELLQHMTALESLEINSSLVLSELPEGLRSLTCLQSLTVFACSDLLVLPEWIGELASLQQLCIWTCDVLSSLPQSLGQLTSLQMLSIDACYELHRLPECIGELCSLRKLRIRDCPRLTCLPQMSGLTSLQELLISDCPGLTSLPQGMMSGLASLEKLIVSDCPGIKFLPQDIKGLTTLMELRIRRCPDLERRCETGKGEDWHLISHIPNLRIW